MSAYNSTTAKELARAWLHQWADNIRARNATASEFKAIYDKLARDGAPMTMKAVDDPSAELFKHLTVEIVLNSFNVDGDPRTYVRELIEHLYIERGTVMSYVKSKKDKPIYRCLRRCGKSSHGIVKFFENMHVMMVEALADSILDSANQLKRRRGSV